MAKKGYAEERDLVLKLWDRKFAAMILALALLLSAADMDCAAHCRQQEITTA